MFPTMIRQGWHAHVAGLETQIEIKTVFWKGFYCNISFCNVYITAVKEVSLTFEKSNFQKKTLKTYQIIHQSLPVFDFIIISRTDKKQSFFKQKYTNTNFSRILLALQNQGKVLKKALFCG